MGAIENLNRSRDEFDINFSCRLDDMREDIQGLLKKSRNISNQLAQLTSLSTKLSNFDKEQHRRQKQATVIKSLHFTELHRRWSRIEDADQFTNAWLFDQSQTSFVEWLRHGRGMFWISGKVDKSNTLKRWTMS